MYVYYTFHWSLIYIIYALEFGNIQNITALAAAPAGAAAGSQPLGWEVGGILLK